MTKFEYYVDADKINVMRAPKGSTCGMDQEIVALCATGEAGGMKVALQISAMLNAAALRAPEAADAGAVAMREALEEIAAWTNNEAGYGKAAAIARKALGAPTAAGIAAPPAMTDGEQRAYHDYERSAFAAAADAARIADGVAAPPAASADALERAAKIAEDEADNSDQASSLYDGGSGALGYEKACRNIAEKLRALTAPVAGTKQRDMLPAETVAWAFIDHHQRCADMHAELTDLVRRARNDMTAAPVAGADAEMRERAAKVAENYSNVKPGDICEVQAGDWQHGIAKAIRALPLSLDATRS